jgi:TPR repeat protein
MDLKEAAAVFRQATAISRDPARGSECASLYEAAAAAGLPEAQLNLGAMCESGERGIPKDVAKAAVLYASAARAGLSAAQYNLARLYDSGTGVEHDPRMAAGWYQRAAEQGNADAMVNLAVILARGEHGQRDPTAAVQWYAKAAQLGHPLGMRALGLAHLTGEGGMPRNASVAEDWLRRAAEHGDGYSWFELGRFFWHGKGGRRERLQGLRCAVRAAKTDDGWHEIVDSFKPWTMRVLRRLHLTND